MYDVKTVKRLFRIFRFHFEAIEWLNQMYLLLFRNYCVHIIHNSHKNMIDIYPTVYYYLICTMYQQNKKERKKENFISLVVDVRYFRKIGFSPDVKGK